MASSPPAAQPGNVEAPPETTVPDGRLPQEAIDFATRCFDAARNGDSDFLLAAIDAGLPPSLTSEKGGNDLIMLAAYHGHALLVEGLIARGANPNKVNDRGQTPLSGAVFKKETAVVRALIDGGADPRAGTPSAVQAAEMFKMPEYAALFGATAPTAAPPAPTAERAGR